MSTSRLEIDLGAIERNFSQVRRIVGPSVGICAVLKQDAYGLGAPRIARRALACGAKSVAVYNLDEARTVFEAAPEATILVLMPVAGVERTDPLYRCAAAGRLHVVVHDSEQLVALNDGALRLGVTIPVHVQVDTGLSRGGERTEDSVRIIERIGLLSRVRLAGVMTHFASPGDDAAFTAEQWRLFTEVVKTARGVARGELDVHASNSCGTFRSRGYHGTMVRVGECLYGMVGGAVWGEGRGLAGMEFAAEARAMEPALRWTSTIAHVQEIPAGWPVGYGSTWRAPRRSDGRPTRIALVPVGYADGYPRSLGGDARGGPGVVGFTGRRWGRRGAMADPDGPGGRVFFAPVVGRVSMDQITVDATDVPEEYLAVGREGSALAGAEVELIGADPASPTHLPALASAGGTIAHELLCRLSSRLDRVYRHTGLATAGAGAAARVAAAPM
ncbi:MAG: alanine racemase [Phycisphaeraceae bacterium]|nr:alanine racemase [Phycisphaeraceae bacterium]